ncbi:hypothetical protein HD806DRAFT_547073 [Xylariaceae sp. AK1471]|nr:hypothetical protein HD806DRAFT_547073 [Xylariaceae sp. AK1471]
MWAFKVGEEYPAYPPPCDDCPDCPDCQMGFYSLEEQSESGLYLYSSGISGAKASSIISGHLTTIREATDVLAKAIGTHPDLFMSRWKKHSQAKRQKLLQDVAPHLAPNPWHCFDYSDIPAGAPPEYVRNPKTRKQLLLPWLDLDTLKCHPHVLFALLHYRIQYPPQDWAAFDIKQLDMGWKEGYFEVRFAQQGVIVHGQRYGDLVEWDLPASHRADILGFPRAELLFEAQAYLMSTLRDLVIQVLDGVDDATPARTSKWTELTSTCSFRRTDETEHWSPYIYPAFSPPPTFDLSRLTSLANARLGAIRDHLWQLQCNPAYMCHQMKLFLGSEVITDSKRALRSFFFFIHIMGEVHSYMSWRLVEIECRKAEELQRRFRDSIHPGQPLPRKYETAIGELELLLVNMVKHTAGDLFRDMAASDEFSQCLTIRTPPDNLPVVEYDITPLGKWNTHDPLLWCLVQMRTPPDSTPFLFDNALLHSYLQHHLSVSNSQEKARVSEFVRRWIADMSAFSEMLVVIRLSRPRAKRADLREVMKKDHREEWAIIGNSGKVTDSGAVQALSKRAAEGLFKATPPSGPKNHDWLRQSRVTRAALENFWSSVHEMMTTWIGNHGISKDEVQRILQVLTATESIEYQQAVQAEEAKILAEIEQLQTMPKASRHLAASDGETATMKTMNTEHKPEKLKTRPQESQGEADVCGF